MTATAAQQRQSCAKQRTRVSHRRRALKQLGRAPLIARARTETRPAVGGLGVHAAVLAARAPMIGMQREGNKKVKKIGWWLRHLSMKNIWNFDQCV
jgi:hypothetical protein